MSTVFRACIAFIVLLGALSSVADLPPPPSPENACNGSRQGARCDAWSRAGGWIESGVCQHVGSQLVCLPRRAPGN